MWRSPPRLLTEAAYGSLKPPPTGRLRRVLLHLSHSMTLARLLDTTPHNGLAMLISRTSRRISTATVGRPERGRDFQRQYDLNPARCQRTTVSGFTIVSAWRVLGAKRDSPTKIRRSMALKVSLFGRCRRWMLR